MAVTSVTYCHFVNYIIVSRQMADVQMKGILYKTSTLVEYEKKVNGSLLNYMRTYTGMTCTPTCSVRLVLGPRMRSDELVQLWSACSCCVGTSLCSSFWSLYSFTALGMEAQTSAVGPW